MNKIKVLFVCKGNICRSPTAHGIFRDIVRENNLQNSIYVASCGTSSRIWKHEGDGADMRSLETAKKYDCDLSDQKSQQLGESDFSEFDYIVAMDQENVATMKEMFPKADFSKVSRMLEYASTISLKDVPDPYYEDNFDKVFLMIHTACHELFEKIKLEYKL
ncbi:low molecular weight phosphotyrosine protein phosphatase [Francisella halioticida]|uniref:protein-tyrosine-phosphatase n=1 Tax=Francisella halioticida TaxID=549298 RepID=A0ABM6LZR9_9GAMM|nr:low molecular weight protein-tyrosine-phosphatase [Francisella halioticida]ASG68189.1 protein tyrosine phosphatase [Francisella halioticida]BCD90976.1 low molecular weight phosphotyrosine protein phosphatase [Francisella halioticida]